MAEAGHTALVAFMQQKPRRSLQQLQNTRNQTPAWGHPGAGPWLPPRHTIAPAHLPPRPGRDLFFIIFGSSRHAASCQAPLTPINMHQAGFMETDGVGGCAAVEGKAERGRAGAP